MPRDPPHQGSQNFGSVLPVCLDCASNLKQSPSVLIRQLAEFASSRQNFLLAKIFVIKSFRPWRFMHAALNNWAANPSTKFYHQLRKCQVCKVCWESSYANQHLCCSKFCSSILSTHHKSCPPKLTTKCLIAPMNCTYCTLNYRANFVRHQHSRFSGCKCNVKA